MPCFEGGLKQAFFASVEISVSAGALIPLSDVIGGERSSAAALR